MSSIPDGTNKGYSVASLVGTLVVLGIVEFVSLKDESETGHGGGANDGDGSRHGEAVGLGLSGR
jgi:hypothetical protein